MTSATRHVAVTGASAGIGRALARRLTETGTRLSLVARREAELEKLARELEGRGARCRVLPTDLAADGGATAWLPAAEAAHGPIDVLVVNAGVQHVGRALDAPPEVLARQLALNLLGPRQLIGAVAPAMVARGAGAIVVVSSLAALNPMPGMADYALTKAGIAAFSEALNVELAPRGVHVLTVYPGPVRTEMEEAAWAHLDVAGWQRRVPVGTPEGLADRVARALDARRPRVIYPPVYAVSHHLRSLSQWVTARLAPRPR